MRVVSVLQREAQASFGESSLTESEESADAAATAQQLLVLARRSLARLVSHSQEGESLTLETALVSHITHSIRGML